ncbi:PilZ domain-containing protein [Desulfococcus multivorans]|uniref:Type IV pilus assembly PilZ n=1 Tax=Desulfococcus multivorans DSM 2059 TaxID=1121405 RepID=S7TKQ3_DESML|nr:PilZ domain-containing protein [Desulfococcus multivorans]AOY58302.1 putative pilus assembly protein PilZ, type IV [Desulfococcus multivorans]AQV00640.1 hypothetical protein B2D07_07545 [Desulfococcus multivorans]EPR37757.1 type IV pilus assembly PilZ [Desulfococcus multivorans DSM 2059]SJZ98420.1 PilZ domain-containing protein [Desulfococcus multivorans DSM 2059]
MNVVTQRAFARNEYRAPIRFSRETAQTIHKGEMLNSSVGGMAFIAEHELRPGDGILIQLLETAPDACGLDVKQDYYAEVRWCIPGNAEEVSNFQVGVRFLMETCRLCDEIIHPCRLDNAGLCDACREHVCSFSDGTIKDCIENYLMGNVL